MFKTKAPATKTAVKKTAPAKKAAPARKAAAPKKIVRKQEEVRVGDFETRARMRGLRYVK